MANSRNVNNFELCTEPDAVISCLEPEKNDLNENEFTRHELDNCFMDRSVVHSLNSSRSVDIQSDLYRQNASFSIKQFFNPLNILDISHVETSLYFSDVESDKHVESIVSTNFESCSSDDEIYYSDDDSNEIFLSENEEKFNFSNIPLQQTEQKGFNKFSENTLVKIAVKDAPVSESDQCNLIFNVDSKERSVLTSNELKHRGETEQKLLKVLNLGGDYANFINVRSSYKDLPLISHSHSKSVERNCVTEQKENYEYFPSSLDERKSGLLIEPYSLAEPNEADKVVTASMPKRTEGAEQKSSEVCDKKWLFHWGDNHNFIARTWQKDFVPVKEDGSNGQLFYDAKVSTALCKEIKEEGEELLKGLCSVPAIGNTVFGSDLCKPKKTDLHSICLSSQIEGLANHCEEETSVFVRIPENHKITVDQVENYVPILNNSFTFDNIENVPEMQCTVDYSVSFENNPFKAANFPNLSAFPNAGEDNGSFKDYYMEGGGWSLASDSMTDFYCDNPYERSCSLSDLDLEKSTDYLELFYQKRQHCASETDVEMTAFIEASNPCKKIKQKFASRKRPCCFFLQGTCTRSDCRYSHDLSTTTCRFWMDGSCFKGSTCPFLHGYSVENDERHSLDDACFSNHSPDLGYSLESETDFPSLSSTKSEKSRIKSGAINIPYVKGSKKKQREK